MGGMGGTTAEVSRNRGRIVINCDANAHPSRISGTLMRCTALSIAFKCPVPSLLDWAM
jgi:hypothetical protein